MNTVKKGDLFEKKCYEWLKNAITDGQFAFIGEDVRIYPKKGYYSHKRKSDIVFDIAVEIWLKNAKNYFQLWLIECKNYRSKNVPIDDIEEFIDKVGQVTGKNVKAIMISASSFSQSVKNRAESDGVMLIEAREDNYEIIWHRRDKNEASNLQTEDEKIFYCITNALGLNNAHGFQNLSAIDVEKHALQVLSDYNNAKYPIVLPNFIKFLEQTYQIHVYFENEIISSSGQKLLGYCHSGKREIIIDRHIEGTNRLPFVLGHELGHMILHSKIRMNNYYYQNFLDSHYNFFADKHLLTNVKQWLEWQANQFSVSLFLPKHLLIQELTQFRKNMGIRIPNHIYLDDQRINICDFMNTISHLLQHFGVSKTTVKYRLNALNLLTNEQKTKKAVDIARNIIDEL